MKKVQENLKSERILFPEDYLFPGLHAKIKKIHKEQLKKIKVHQHD